MHAGQPFRSHGESKVETNRRSRVDDAMLLFGDAVQATDPLAAVSQRPDTLDLMRTLESGCKNVPWKGWNDRG